MAPGPGRDKAAWVLKPKDAWHGSKGLAGTRAGRPIKVTISRRDVGERHDAEERPSQPRWW